MNVERSRTSIVLFLGLVALLVGVSVQVFVYAEVIPIKQITADKLESMVMIKGKITNVVTPSSDRAPYSYYVDDGTETIRVVVWRNIYAQIRQPERFKIGEEVAITGTVKQFRGSLEVHLVDATGIRLAGEAAARMTSAATVATTSPASKVLVPPSAAAMKVKIAEINNTFAGKKVMVEGDVSAFRESTYERAPHVVTLADGEHSISVVFWQDVMANLTADQKPAVGKHLQITGRVSEFKGELQIRVSEAGDIKVIAK
jgi:DNA/RNA endonuclease YhcR with UshA esterase domain